MKLVSKCVLVSALFIIQLSYSQLRISEKLKLIETSEHIKNPYELFEKLKPVNNQDSIALITFSKVTGELLEHSNVSKKAILADVRKTGFQDRYFVMLLGTNAIFYLDN
jgi:thioredoxin-related protein